MKTRMLETLDPEPAAWRDAVEDREASLNEAAAAAPDEIRACRPWLEAEISALEPKLVVCLGATAAQAVLGASFRVTKSRGTLVSSSIAPRVMATVHPSSILRAPDAESRHAEMELFVADLRTAVSLLKGTNDEK